MEEFITNPFTIGLGVGLVLAILTWFGAMAGQRKLKKEVAELQRHLHTQMKITTKGTEEMEREVKELKSQNENLRVTVATLETKPGRAEIKTLHVYDKAVGLMRQRAPGFAPVWEEVLKEAEEEVAKAEGGFGKLLKKVFRPAQIAESASTEPKAQKEMSND